MVYSKMMSDSLQPGELTTYIKEFCIEKGAVLAGIADLQPLKTDLETSPPDLLQPYTAAISLALPLDKQAVNAMNGEPTPAYATDCREINRRLNTMTEEIVQHIKSLGYRAEAVAASEKLVEGGTEGSVSHKAIAIMAGLGWQGKSLLVVTSKYGPRVRLSSVLTDMPLVFDSPVKNRCANCTKCTEVCPVGAIRNINTDFHYSSRDEAIDLNKCHSNTLKYMTVPGIEYTFCGQCIPVCPYGKNAVSGLRSSEPDEINLLFPYLISLHL
ncbi:epoxyqueuosine reductase [bacterium]|nr:epoxyqueuosine reductase [bacterium]